MRACQPGFGSLGTPPPAAAAPARALNRRLLATHPPAAPRRALVESFRRADRKAQVSFKNHELDEATSGSLFDGVAKALDAGTLKVQKGGKQVAGFFK